MTTTWKDLMREARDEAGDASPLVAVAPPDLDWDKRFYDGFGGEEGQPFTAWTEQRVYFPATYDGAEWVASAPRNPCETAMGHVGRS